MNIIKLIIILLIIVIFLYIVSKIITSTVIILNKNKLNLENIMKINKDKILYGNNVKLKNKKIKENNKKIYNLLNKHFDFKDDKKVINNSICLNHEECIKNKNNSCNYGLTNYIYPDHLSDFDKKIFMMNKQDNFTLQDYINWLSCYKNNKNDLRYCDFKNLLKIENNDSNIKMPKICKKNDISCHYDFNNIF